MYLRGNERFLGKKIKKDTFGHFFNGCQDHIAHLASTEFEKCLINRTIAWQKLNFIEGKKHISSVALCHIISRIRCNNFYRAFKSFVKKNTGQRPSFSRFSETRFASINLLSIQYLRWERYLMAFFYFCRSLLTEIDLKYLKILLDPEIRSILRMRAIFGSKILFPTMKLAKEASQGSTFFHELEKTKQIVFYVEQNPQTLSLIDDTTTPICF